jgi:hypothetical protein
LALTPVKHPGMECGRSAADFFATSRASNKSNLLTVSYDFPPIGCVGPRLPLLLRDPLPAPGNRFFCNSIASSKPFANFVCSLGFQKWITIPVDARKLFCVWLLVVPS